MRTTYLVKSGDTLYGISKQYGISVSDLKKINNLSSDILTIGQTLIIDTSVETPKTSTYTVKKGDNLYSIARSYDTTVNDIIKLNNLKSSLLSIGQVLQIPGVIEEEETIPTLVKYTVKKGDTLYSVAKKYNTTVDQIIRDNLLLNNTIDVGQVLQIRSGQNIIEIEECFGPSYIPPIGYVSYTVKSGDNLYSIARRYDTTVNSIKTLNNLKSNLLSIGQVLKIKEGAQ